MSVINRGLKCLKCGHQWRGLWDIASTMQPFGEGCPRCKETTTVRCQTSSEAAAPPAVLESANVFSVVRIDDGVRFCLDGENDGRHYKLQGEVPWELAINFAAWLMVMADPNGKEFCRLVEEIKKR